MSATERVSTTVPVRDFETIYDVARSLDLTVSAAVREVIRVGAKEIRRQRGEED